MSRNYSAIDDDFKVEVFEYLDDLRDSGETNMYGASTYIEEEFNTFSRKDASKYLLEWMRDYDKYEEETG